MTFQLESANFFTGLTICLDGALMVPMWNDYNKLPVNILSLPPWCSSVGMWRSQALIFWALSQWAFKHFVGCHVCFSLFSIVSPPWFLTLTMTTLHLLKLLRDWTLVKLSLVWALDESLSYPSSELPRTSSFELSLELQWKKGAFDWT